MNVKLNKQEIKTWYNAFMKKMILNISFDTKKKK